MEGSTFSTLWFPEEMVLSPLYIDNLNITMIIVKNACLIYVSDDYFFLMFILHREIHYSKQQKKIMSPHSFSRKWQLISITKSSAKKNPSFCNARALITREIMRNSLHDSEHKARTAATLSHRALNLSNSSNGNRSGCCGALSTDNDINP